MKAFRPREEKAPLLYLICGLEVAIMPATKVRMNCSVCGAGGNAQFKADYKGQTYYFCSESDKKEFQKHPQVYAGMERVSKTAGKAA